MATTKRLLPRKITTGSTEADLPKETKGELQARTRYEVRLRRPDGKEVSRTFRTLALAEQFEREQLHARDRGAMHDPQAGRITLDAWVIEWRQLRANLRPSTERIYEHNLKAHVLPSLGSIELATIKRDDVRRLLVKLGRDGLSPASVHQAFRVLRTVLAAAVESGRIIVNPAAGRGLAPKITKVELRIPTPDEVATLAETIEPRYRAFVFVAAYCGLRRGELAGLRWGRVDLLRRRLSVIEQLNDQGTPAPLKSDAARREVPIPSFVADALSEHAAGGYGQPGPTGLVFTSPSGEYLDVANFRSRFWAPTLVATDLEGIRIYDLRHCCASLMIAAGADIKSVQTVTGHGSATVTLDTYGHLMPGRLDDIADRLDVLGRAAVPSPTATVLNLSRDRRGMKGA